MTSHDLTAQAEARHAEACEFATELLRLVPNATLGDHGRMVLALSFARHGMASAFEAACALPPRLCADAIATRIAAWVKGRVA